MIKNIGDGFFKHICERCDNIWISKIEEPKVCPSKKCTSRAYWNKKRVRK